MDVAYLEYLLKKKGITKAQLSEAMGWSSMTCYRRFQDYPDLEASSWMAGELEQLLALGITFDELGKIFFTEFVS